MRGRTELDPKGLMYEAYRIEGITDSQCRSIFLDWALGLRGDQDNASAIRTILDLYAEDRDDHPMTQVLKQGLEKVQAPRRRGGWRSRPRPQLD